MKTAFIGSVDLSYVALKTLIDEGVHIDVIFSLYEHAAQNVSDYYPLHMFAAENGIECVQFVKVTEIIGEIKRRNIDYLFVIGLSQLIPKEILNELNEYAIGFHPTELPKYRGRAPIPWMILLNEKEPKISLFRLDEGVDSGDLIIQEPYFIKEDDYACDVYNKVKKALVSALHKCLPSIYSGKVEFIKQDEQKATYLLKRRACDGEIDWKRMSGKEIYDLIRAVGQPYPGAFSFYNEEKMIINKASLIKNDKYFGMPGQIAHIDGKNLWVLTNDNKIIQIKEYEIESNREVKLTVGGRFY